MAAGELVNYLDYVVVVEGQESRQKVTHYTTKKRCFLNSLEWKSLGNKLKILIVFIF